MRLARSLSSFETWGFGLTGHLFWLGTAPAIHAALGPQAIFVWLPAALVSMMLNLQVKRLGMYWTKASGGTPAYTARLLQNYPGLARYAAVGYFVGWISIPAMNAIILTDLIKANLEPFGISCPETVLKIGFTVIAFIVAFSGTRALAILHLCFVIPAIGLLLDFCLQGIGWVALSPTSHSLILPSWSSFSFVDWAKWYFVAVYAIYGCETSSSFVADSQRPAKTLQCLPFSAALIPLVYLGGSWLLTCLAAEPGLGDSTFFNLLAAAKPFWGSSASFLVTFLIVCGCLLGSATAVSAPPRILYQLALDGCLSPVFAVVSGRGVLGPALLFTFLLNLACLVWGDLSRLVMVTGTGWFACFIALHLGLWLRRGFAEVLWPWWGGCVFLVEIVIFIVGGLAWSWQDLLIGLLLPLAILAFDAAIRHIALPPFQPSWWIHHYRMRSYGKVKDFVMLQVGILILLICSTAIISWNVRAKLDGRFSDTSTNLLVVLLLTIAFVGVAIACWTSLPQVAAIVEAREAAEHLFQIALDAILVLDENGVIRSCNPATEHLFGANKRHLIGRPLSELFSGLAPSPEHWSSRSEQTLLQGNQSIRTVEMAISQRAKREPQEYVAILRDITERKRAEEERNRFFQLSLDMLCIAEFDGYFKQLNPAWEKTLGFTNDELLAKPFIEFVHPEDRELTIAEAQRAATGENTVSFENRYLCKDGSYKWLSWNSTTFSAQQLYYAVAHDITERKQTEEVLQQSEARFREQATHLERTLQNLQKAQAQLIQTEKMSSLGQLVAGVAHEINNPVNFIYGNLSHISDYTQDLLALIDLYQQHYPNIPPQIQELMAKIDLDFLIEDIAKILNSMRVGADRIREIVLTLRNFSRLDEAEMKSVNIHDGLDSTLLILQNRLKAKPERPSIEVVKEYGDLPLVECYPGQLNQVFMNVLSNALDALHKYNNEQSSFGAASLTLEVIKTHPSNITIRTQVLNRDWVGICIKDNGPGMTESVKTRLFDPFFTTKPVGEGTGLGLSISYQIVVDKHCGHLKCISSPGQGAEFWIEIPIKQN